MNRNLALFAAGLLLATPVAADTLYKYQHPDGRIEYSSGTIRGAKLLEVIQTPRTAPAAPAARSAVTPAQGSAVDARINQRIATREQAWLELRLATAALAAAEARLAADLDPRPGESGAVAGSVVTATIDPAKDIQTPALSPSEAVGGPGGPQIGGAAAVTPATTTPPTTKPTPPRREGDPRGPDAPEVQAQDPVAGGEGTPKPAPKPVPGAEGTPKPAPKPNPLAERRPAGGADPVPAPAKPAPSTPATPAAAAPATAIGAPQAAVTPAAGGSMTGRRSGGTNAYQARISALEMEIAVARIRLEEAERNYNRFR